MGVSLKIHVLQDCLLHSRSVSLSFESTTVGGVLQENSPLFANVIGQDKCVKSRLGDDM